MEKKPKRIGNYINEKAGTGFAGNVWDKDYLMPTITTCGGVVDNLQSSENIQIKLK